MKYASLALFLICLNFMVGIVNTMDIGLISAGSNTLDGKIDEDDLSDELGGNISTVEFSDSGWDPISYVTTGFNVLLRFGYQVTLGLPNMLKSTPFNLPDIWCDFFIILQIIIYAIGLSEFARGMTVEY